MRRKGKPESSSETQTWFRREGRLPEVMRCTLGLLVELASLSCTLHVKLNRIARYTPLSDRPPTLLGATSCSPSCSVQSESMTSRTWAVGVERSALSCSPSREA